MVRCYTCDNDTDDYVVTDGMFLCRSCEVDGRAASGLLMLIFTVPVIIISIIIFAVQIMMGP